MTENNLIIFEDAKVSETRNKYFYRVTLEDVDVTIYIREKRVERICDKSEEEPAIVAILLAYIEYIRRYTSTDKVEMRVIDERAVVEATVKLFEKYPAETLIFHIKSMKYLEIQSVFESSEPIEELEKII